MTAQPYWELSGLEQVYLEDSYVLSIEEDADTVRFRMEFVLREEHPAFEPPEPEARYCYRRGELTFVGARDIIWQERREVVSWDARGEHDLGNIDTLTLDGGWYMAEGDWGRIKLHADRVEARVLPRDGAA